MTGMPAEEMRRTVSTRQAEYLTLLLLYLTEIEQASITVQRDIRLNPHQEVIISFCCGIKLHLLSCENAFLFLFAIYFYLEVALF
jgi:hypothetical protein